MELRHLRYFAALAETLNFSRAAERLHLTQPALSRQIRDLEEELGVKLLERGNGPARLTSSGRKFLKGAVRLLEDADELLASTGQSATGKTAPLRLALFGSLVADHMTPFLRRMVRRDPSLRFTIVEAVPSDALRSLGSGKVDAVLSGRPAPARLRGLESRVVWLPDQDVILPSHHRFAKRRSLALAELRNEKWGIWDERAFPGFGRDCLRSCRAAGFRADVVAETDSLASTLIHVAAGDYVSHAPSLARKIPHPGVVFVPTEPRQAIDIPTLLVWNPRSTYAAQLSQLADDMIGAGLSR